MAKEEEDPIDIEAQYPWGTKTPTYAAAIILIAINVVLLSVLFLVYIEIPFMQGEDVLNLNFIQTAHAQLTDPGTDMIPPVNGEFPSFKENPILYCILIITANTILVYITKTVGKWLNKIEKRCRRRKCKWWCLCCNKWLCWLVTVLKWVTWVITIVSTIITTVLTYLCFNPTPTPVG